MQAREIPAEQWTQFVDDFSKQHAGQRVTIEVLHPEAGPQYVAEGVPLMGLSFDTTGTRPSSLEIATGDLPQGMIRHVIDLPMTIQVAEDERTPSVAVQIQPAQGPITLLLIQGEVH